MHLVTGWFCLDVISNSAMKLFWIKELVRGEVFFFPPLLQKVMLQLFSQTRGKFVDLWIMRTLRYIRDSFRILSWHRGHVPLRSKLALFSFSGEKEWYRYYYRWYLSDLRPTYLRTDFCVFSPVLPTSWLLCFGVNSKFYLRLILHCLSL